MAPSRQNAPQSGSFIELFEGRRRLGRFNLPSELTGENGGIFRLQRSVKGGGNGIVFESRPIRGISGCGNKCAIKLLKQQSEARVDRFRNELRILRMLHHPAVAAYFDSGVIALQGGYKVPWIAMELGEQNLREDVQTNGVLPNESLLLAGKQMCEALEHIHSKQIVHRDVKPDNFVWRDGNIQMIDFGIAKLAGEDVSARPLDQFTQESEFVGPVFFSSPELIAYASDKSFVVDHRSDVFQIGKVLWFLATGRISAGIPSRSQCPFGGKLHAIVSALLSDDPRDRPESASKTKSELSKLG